MGSCSEATKKKIQVNVKKPEMESLKAFGGLLKDDHRSAFIKRYGMILNLMRVDVQVDAITALVQFYDSPMRCFTFKNFQMAPTLEEYEQILGYSLKDIKPYRFLGHYPSSVSRRVASILKVKEGDLKNIKDNQNCVKGLPQAYLEERLKNLAEVKDWSSFIDVLALTIYGIVLFPRIDKYVDLAAIDIFLAWRDRGENPVPAVLADTYYTLTYCHEKKGKKISCCLPVLYVWLTTHMFNHKVKTKSRQEWSQCLADLTENTILWYPRWGEVDEVIYQCGTFPNVPLMGSKGCINYNPSVALRQLGYPLLNPPTEESVAPFVVYDMDKESEGLVKKVRQAWDRVIRKGKKELGVRSCDAKDSYRQWLRARVQEVKLPFLSSCPIIEETPVQVPVSSEEVEKLKAALAESDEEKKKLQKELVEVQRAYEKMQLENARKTVSLEKASKRARIEEECKIKTQDCLYAADTEMGMRREERNIALAANQQLKDMLKNSKVAERNAKQQLEILDQQLKKVVAEYEKRINSEKQCKEEAMEMAAFREGELRREQEKTCALKNNIKELRGENNNLREQLIKMNSFAEGQESVIKELRKEGYSGRIDT